MFDVQTFVSPRHFRIAKVRGRQVLDSRGNPTVEVEVITYGGGFGRALAPSGASKGSWEAIEKRDKEDKRYFGRGVYTVISAINDEIDSALRGLDSRKQYVIDKTLVELDGTENKSRLGANAIIATSLAVAKVAANTLGVPLFFYIGGLSARILPVPMMNIINGGKHAGNELAIQEFMIVPVGADVFSEALRIGVEVYMALKEVLRKKYGRNAINVGDEGGFAPPLSQTEEALNLLMEAIENAGYSEAEVKLALDAAATEFYSKEENIYMIDGKKLSRDDLLEFYRDLVSRYPIISIEDPFHEEDYEGFRLAKEKLKIMIVGDDIFVTNPKRFERGIKIGAANAILIKPNQIGTLTETMLVVEMAKENNYKTVMSHRSGETEDTTIADLAVGLGTGIIKTGAPARGERTAKYNRLLRIESILGSYAKFLGIKAFQ